MSLALATRPIRHVTRIRYEPRGGARELFMARDQEVLLSGPAGTGKSRGALEKLHLCACKYAGMRALMVRKTLTSLTASTLVTFQEKVLHRLDGVEFFGGSRVEPAAFRYPNGSRIVVGGMDKATKVLSTEYDMIYANEAIELFLNDWENLSTRLRNGVMPYQQLLGDCNPDAPTHWLKQRADARAIRMLESRHADNPTITPEYLQRLDALTGVRRLRLRDGLWAAAEGMIYEGWDRTLHLVNWFPIPPEWPRYWAVDFGFTHPFVWQAWAEDPDGRLYRYREIYRTQRLVEDHAQVIKRLTAGDPRPRAIICDHDAEDRATLERHLGMKTIPAHKAVSPGIQAVASRLKVAGDGKPRLFLLRDALDERDTERTEAKRPTCTDEEVESYIWDITLGGKLREHPRKEDDHGMDTLRYMIAHRDGRSRALVTF